MKTFEYLTEDVPWKMIKSPEYTHPFQCLLNEFAKDGWEFVLYERLSGTDEYRLIFKRERKAQ